MYKTSAINLDITVKELPLIKESNIVQHIPLREFKKRRETN